MSPPATNLETLAMPKIPIKAPSRQEQLIQDQKRSYISKKHESSLDNSLMETPKYMCQHITTCFASFGQRPIYTSQVGKRERATERTLDLLPRLNVD